MINYSIDIAIIDDGINEKVYNIGDLKYNKEIYPNLKIVDRIEYNPYMLSHGTICSAIIKKYAPEAQFTSMKILNAKNKKGKMQQLIEALYWCAEIGIKLVNLSLGSIEPRDFGKIKECINEVTKYGLIIIAACNNKNVYTVPACLTNVIGVKSSIKYSDEQYQFNKYALEGIEISANGRHYLKNILGEYCFTNTSNSYAAPLITANICKMLISNPALSLEEIKNELFKRSQDYQDISYNPYICINTDWINKYILLDKSNININDESEYDKADTIIIDSVDKLEYSMLNRIIQNYKSIRKNIIYISSEKLSTENYELLLVQEGIKIWNNEIYENYLKLSLPENHIDIDIDIPLIAIYNFCNHNILTNLNQLFIKDGYNSIMISTKGIDVINGCEYLPESFPVKKFLSYIYGKYNCDIMILNIDNEVFIDKIRKTIEFDIEININNKIIGKSIISKEKTNGHDYVHIEIDENCSNKNIQNIYKRIIKLLNC